MKTKQVIVIRKDLKMRRGKEIAQGSHASMTFLTNRLHAIRWWELWKWFVLVKNVEWLWMSSSFAKVVCKVNSETDLMEIYNKAIRANLEVHLITDSGRTEFGGIPTNTCLAIGPDFCENIDKITGHLDLY